MALSKTKIAEILRAKRPATPKKFGDHGGLYILVTSTALLWRYDYRLKRPGQDDDGRRKTLYLGPYGTTPPDLDLDGARRKHLDAREVVNAGGDPAADRATIRQALKSTTRARRQTAIKLTPARVRGSGKASSVAGSGQDTVKIPDTGKPGLPGTFGLAADGWNALMQKKADAGKRSPKTRARDNRMVRYLKNSFGDVGIADTDVPHLVKLLDLFEGEDKYTTRQRLQSTAIHIMGFARGKGMIKTNPFIGVSFGQAYTAPLDEPRPAIIELSQFEKLLRDVAGYDGRQGNLVGRALDLLKLVFVRPGNMVGAEWREFDLDEEMMWTLPFKKLKQAAFRDGIKELKGKPHYVPLSRQAVALLRDLKRLTGNSDFLFPNPENASGHITTESLENALNSLGYKDVHCPHGFRSSASTMLNAERITVEGSMDASCSINCDAGCNRSMSSCDRYEPDGTLVTLIDTATLPPSPSPLMTCGRSFPNNCM